MTASPCRPSCMVAWNAVALQFWAAHPAQLLMVRRRRLALYAATFDWLRSSWAVLPASTLCGASHILCAAGCEQSKPRSLPLLSLALVGHCCRHAGLVGSSAFSAQSCWFDAWKRTEQQAITILIATSSISENLRGRGTSFMFKAPTPGSTCQGVNSEIHHETIQRQLTSHERRNKQIDAFK